MDDSQENGNVQAESNSIAIGGISVGGNVGDIRIGHSIGYSPEQVSILLSKIKSEFQPKAFDGRCPYKGLAVFEEEDAELFFGRERLVNDLLNRVKESRTVFITGPSGSGKSSLVRAGLLHSLKQGALKSSERWLYETMKPGREPIKDLALAFSRLKSPELADYFQAHAVEADVLHKCAESVLSGNRDQRFVLFVDQFEEVFTQVNQEAERLAFLELLAHAGTAENGRVIVVFAMRSDFVSNCAVYPMLNELLSKEFRQIGAMQPEELVAAIALPARHVGLPVEPELIAQIINDMKGEPGALPLMQFALKDLFDSQQEKGGVIALTLGDYLRHGGIHKSLERHADRTFSELSEDEQTLARSIFSGLIEIGRGAVDTRRTALFDELIPVNTKANEVLTVVQKLADARLVITDEQAGTDTVTISHEKLIDAWPWLRQLVNENRDVIALQNEIAADAREWEEHGRDPSYLYTGARLANAREQLEARKLVLSGLAQEFTQAGIKAHADELAAAAQQIRRFRILTIGLLLVLLVAGLLGFVAQQQASSARANAVLALANQETAQASITEAVAQRSIAEASAAEAERQAQIARSQVLTVNSQVDKRKVQLNLLLSIEAYKHVASLPYRDTVVARQALRDALSNISGIPVIGDDTPMSGITFSPNGQWLTATGAGTLHLWNMQDPSAEPSIVRAEGALSGPVQFSPNGQWLAAQEGDHSVRLWDVQSLFEQSQLLQAPDFKIVSLVFSPDSHWLAAKGDDNTLRLWDANTLSPEPLALEGPFPFTSIRNSPDFSPDNRWLTTTDGTYVYLWDMENITADATNLQAQKYPFEGISPSTFSFSPDSEWLAIAGSNSVILWNIKNAANEFISLSGQVGSLAALSFSSNGRWLAAASFDNNIYLWDLQNQSHGVTILRGHTEQINAISFSPDSNWLVSASDDLTLRLWPMDNIFPNPILLKGHEGPVKSFAISPDGFWLAAAADYSLTPTDAGTLVTGNFHNTVRLWNLETLSADSIALIGHQESISTLAFSPDGQWLASGAVSALLIAVDPAPPPQDTIARLWNMKDPVTPPLFLEGHRGGIAAIAFSADGKWLGTRSDDLTVRIWDLGRSESSLPLDCDGSGFLDFAYSPDNHWLAAATYNGFVCLWEVPQFSAEPIVLQSTSMPTELMFSPDSKWLALASSDGTLSLWAMKNLSQEPVTLQIADGSYHFSFAFSPDSEWLATSPFIRWSTAPPPEGEGLKLWSMPDFSSKSTLAHEGVVMAFAFSPDGRRLATITTDGTVRLWDMQDLHASPKIMRGREGGFVSSLTFSPDGHWLAAGVSAFQRTSLDISIRIWNLLDPVAESIGLRGHQGGVNVLTFSPDSKRLASGGADHTVRLWDMEYDDVLDAACKVVGRNFTRSEWAQFFPNEEYRATCLQWPLDPAPTSMP